MSPLRRRLIEDMQIRNLAPSTQRAYVAQLVHFACYFRKSPDLLGPAEIRAYLIYLAQEKCLAASSIIVTVSALRFFYTVTLRRPWVIEQDIPTVRRGKKLPVVLSQDEVARFLAAVDNLKHRMVLTVCYATGLRISEAVRLTPAVIDSKRMVIRVEQGKGGKDRYVMLSPKLLDMLRNYWDGTVPGNGSFPVDGPANRSLHPASMPPAGRSDNGAASANRSRRIRCATPSPFTFSRPAPTYVPSSCCSVIAISPPRPGIS
jgi:integrase/recombinase XerD